MTSKITMQEKTNSKWNCGFVVQNIIEDVCATNVNMSTSSLYTL